MEGLASAFLLGLMATLANPLAFGAIVAACAILGPRRVPGRITGAGIGALAGVPDAFTAASYHEGAAAVAGSALAGLALAELSLTVIWPLIKAAGIVAATFWQLAMLLMRRLRSALERGRTAASPKR